MYVLSLIFCQKDLKMSRWSLTNVLSRVEDEERRLVRGLLLTLIGGPSFAAQLSSRWHRSSSISSATHYVPDVIPPLTLSLSLLVSSRETDRSAASLSSPYLSVSFSPPSPLDASRALCSRWLYNWEAATSYVRHSDDLASPSASPRPRPTGPRSITS